MWVEVVFAAVTCGHLRNLYIAFAVAFFPVTEGLPWTMPKKALSLRALAAIPTQSVYGS